MVCNYVRRIALPVILSTVIFGSAGFAEPATAGSKAQVSCRDCHSKSRAETSFVQVSSDPQGLRAMAGDAYERHCIACHRSSSSLDAVSPGHRAASNYYHHAINELGDVPSEDPCLGCHGGLENPTLSELVASLESAPPRFHIEASHPMQAWAAASVRRSGYTVRQAPDQRLPLVEGRVSCVSCHHLAVDTEFALAPLGGRNKLCLGCHLRAESTFGTQLASSGSYLR